MQTTSIEVIEERVSEEDDYTSFKKRNRKNSVGKQGNFLNCKIVRNNFNQLTTSQNNSKSEHSFHQQVKSVEMFQERTPLAEKASHLIDLGNLNQ